MDEVYVYLVDLPSGINEMVAPCADGDYTVYLSAKLDNIHRQRAYEHALQHIRNNDFQKTDVQQIESEAHGLTTDPEQPNDQTDLEKMIKKHRRAAKRRAKKIAEYQKFIDWRMETEAEYKKEHTIFY